MSSAAHKTSAHGLSSWTLTTLCPVSFGPEISTSRLIIVAPGPSSFLDLWLPQVAAGLTAPPEWIPRKHPWDVGLRQAKLAPT